MDMTQATWGIPTWTRGDRLRKALDFAGMSVQAMADYLEVSRNTVSNYLAGRTSAPGAVVKLWAMRTGVPRAWLETGESPGHPGPGDGIKTSAGWAHWESNPEPADSAFSLAVAA